MSNVRVVMPTWSGSGKGRTRESWTITVEAFDMTEAEAEAMFDRVADAAHALDEQVTVSGWVPLATPESTEVPDA